VGAASAAPTRDYRRKEKLAVTISVATVSAASTSSATTAAVSAPPATATAAMTAPPATTTAFSLWTSLVYHQCPAQKILAVERRNHFFSFRVVANFRESKTARLSREAIAQQRQGIGLHTDLCKQRLHLLFRGLERQIPHIQFLHWSFSLCPRVREGTSARLKRQESRRGSQQCAG
jgi:hypothetical protein